MEFHEFPLLYSVSPRFRKRFTRAEIFYAEITSLLSRTWKDSINNLGSNSAGKALELLGSDWKGIEYNRLEMERGWVLNRRPYYCVWPTIIPCLLKLSLNFDSGYVRPPMEVLNIRLPKHQNPLNFEFKGQRYSVKTIMLTQAVVSNEKGLSIWIDIGEIEPVNIPVYTFRNIQTKHGLTLEDSLANLPIHFSANTGVIIPSELINDCMRLACTLCLLDQDSTIIEADVLAADRNKFEETGDQKFVDRAKRRGKIGWNVGRNIEVSPHIRGPSPAALYWTGKGHSVPIIRFRAGCVVHKKKISEIPTGFLGEVK